MRWRLGLVSVVVSAAVGWTSAGAGALGPTEVGWWERPSITIAAVPEGGFKVAQGPDGPSAVAALRVELPEGHTNPRLDLPVHQTSGLAGPSLVVCPATSAWSVADPGPWDERPETGCAAQQAPLTIDEGRARADLRGFDRAGLLDIMIVPGGDGPDVPLAAPVFTVVFGPPDAEAITTEHQTGTASVVAPPPSALPSTTVPSTQVGAARPMASTPTSGALGSATEEAAPTTTVWVRSRDEPRPEASDLAAPEPLPAADLRALGNRPWGLALLAAAAVLAGLLWRLPTERLPWVLGGDGPDPVDETSGPDLGGLGPFRRPRTSDPTPL